MRPNLLENRPTGLDRTAHARLPASLFRTHALPHRERFAAWRESVGVFLEASVLAGAHDEAFNGSVESYLLDGVMLSRCTAGRQKFDRPAARIARDSIDNYMVQLFLRGGVEMRLGRRTELGTPAKIVGFDLGEVLDSVNSDFDLLCVVVPRARLAPLLTHPDSLHGAMPLLHSGAGRLLANFLRDVFHLLPSLLPPQAETAAGALLYLIAAAFNGAEFDPGDMQSPAHRALELRAKMFVKERLGKADLDPESIAAATGLSRSALYRLFEETGGVAGYIREQRLRRCFSELVRMQNSSRQIAEIAYRWGFSDAAHFSRVFKLRFGCSPSEARDAAALAIGPARQDVNMRVGDRRYEAWIAGMA
ncbi:MAG TPA: helix-turn-helix domain-containing protein [Rhizomicrobium sp.]|jgi:AraC-like DNA-binding protein